MSKSGALLKLFRSKIYVPSSQQKCFAKAMTEIGFIATKGWDYPYFIINDSLELIGTTDYQFYLNSPNKSIQLKDVFSLNCSVIEDFKNLLSMIKDLTTHSKYMSSLKMMFDDFDKIDKIVDFALDNYDKDSDI